MRSMEAEEAQVAAWVAPRTLCNGFWEASQRTTQHRGSQQQRGLVQSGMEQSLRWTKWEREEPFMVNSQLWAIMTGPIRTTLVKTLEEYPLLNTSMTHSGFACISLEQWSKKIFHSFRMSLRQQPYYRGSPSFPMNRQALCSIPRNQSHLSSVFMLELHRGREDAMQQCIDHGALQIVLSAAKEDGARIPFFHPHPSSVLHMSYLFCYLAAAVAFSKRYDDRQAGCISPLQHGGGDGCRFHAIADCPHIDPLSEWSSSSNIPPKPTG